MRRVDLLILFISFKERISKLMLVCRSQNTKCDWTGTDRRKKKYRSRGKVVDEAAVETDDARRPQTAGVNMTIADRSTNRSSEGSSVNMSDLALSGGVADQHLMLVSSGFQRLVDTAMCDHADIQPTPLDFFSFSADSYPQPDCRSPEFLPGQPRGTDSGSSGFDMWEQLQLNFTRNNESDSE